MTANFDFDAFDQAINDAPVVGFGSRKVFGKTTMDVQVVSWKDRKPSFRPLGKVPADKSKGEYLQITFEVDVTELNPSLTNPWKRKFDMRRSNKTSKDESKWILTDFSEIIEPALLSVLGADWHKKISKGVYLEIEEATTIETDKEGNLKGWDAKEADPETGEYKHYTNTVPKVTRAFKSKAECQAAREELFGKPGDDMSFGDESEFSSKDITDVQGLIAAVKNTEQLLGILNDAYGQYDLVALLTAAGANQKLIDAASKE